jgi:hypothetical protein
MKRELVIGEMSEQLVGNLQTDSDIRSSDSEATNSGEMGGLNTLDRYSEGSNRPTVHP